MKKVFIVLVALMLMMTGCDKESSEAFKVYMLTENQELEKVIQSFNNVNPDLKIEFEVGINDSLKTPSDAVKELNTQLLSGDGPDIVIMDDLNAEAYSDSEQLAEITEIVEGKLKDMVPAVETNFNRDGKYYYAPLAISLLADSCDYEKSIDFSQLRNLVKIANDEKLNLNGMSFDNLSAIAYRTEVEPYFQKNKIIDSDYLKDFYLQLRDLLNLYDDTAAFASYDQINLKVNHLSHYMKILDKETDIAVDYIDTIFDAQCLYSLKEDKKVNFEFKKVDERYCYIPNCVISISSKSKNKEAAEQLVRYLLSEDGQNAMIEQEFIPVNLNILERYLKENRQYNINGEVAIHQFSQKSKDEFVDTMKKMNVALTTDSHLMEIVMGGARDFLNRETSLEDALNTTQNKLQLYLKE